MEIQSRESNAQVSPLAMPAHGTDNFRPGKT